jgi:hypothetical protein
VLDVIRGRVLGRVSRRVAPRVTSRSIQRAVRLGRSRCKGGGGRGRRCSPPSPAPASQAVPAAVSRTRRRPRARWQARLGQLRSCERGGASTRLAQAGSSGGSLPMRPPQHFTFRGGPRLPRERRERNAPRPRRGRAACPADAHPGRLVQRPAKPRVGGHARSRYGITLCILGLQGPHPQGPRRSRARHTDACVVARRDLAGREMK